MVILQYYKKHSAYDKALGEYWKKGSPKKCKLAAAIALEKWKNGELGLTEVFKKKLECLQLTKTNDQPSPPPSPPTLSMIFMASAIYPYRTIIQSDFVISVINAGNNPSYTQSYMRVPAFDSV